MKTFDYLLGLANRPSRLASFLFAFRTCSNAVEVYVHRLRKMLADAGATVKIHTVRGVGYLMAEEKGG